MFAKKCEIFLDALIAKRYVHKKRGTEIPEGGHMREFLGSLMRGQRIKLGMSLRELALKVDCAPSFLSEVENGLRSAPKSNELLSKLALVLELDETRVIEAATNDKKRRDIKEFREMFARDDELAACYCRAKEEIDKEQLKELLMEAFKKAFEKLGED